jgi:hypothetical protein
MSEAKSLGNKQKLSSGNSQVIREVVAEDRGVYPPPVDAGSPPPPKVNVGVWDRGAGTGRLAPPRRAVGRAGGRCREGVALLPRKFGV